MEAPQPRKRSAASAQRLDEKQGSRNTIFYKIPGGPPQSGGANGSSAVTAGAFGGGIPRPLTRDEALDGRAKPASKAIGPVRIEELRCVTRVGNGPILHSGALHFPRNAGEKWPQNPAWRNRTGLIDPGSTESVHRFTSNAAGAPNGAMRHGATRSMIPSYPLSGRTSLRVLAAGQRAARRIDLQH
jgi:hypothetical protein